MPAKGGAILACRVSPSSSRNEINGLSDDAVKIKVTSAPVDGKANKALVALLCKILKVPKKRITILKGETGKSKKIFIEGLGAGEILTRIREAM